MMALVRMTQLSSWRMLRLATTTAVAAMMMMIQLGGVHAIDCTPSTIKFKIDLSRARNYPYGCFWDSENFGNRPCWAAPYCPMTPIDFKVREVRIYTRNMDPPYDITNVKRFTNGPYETGDVFEYSYKTRGAGKSNQRVYVWFLKKVGVVPDYNNDNPLTIFGIQGGRDGCDSWPTITAGDTVGNVEFVSCSTRTCWAIFLT